MNKFIELISQSAVIEAFGISLLHTLWQGPAIAFILWLIVRAMKNVPAQARYYASILALSLLFGVFCFTFFHQYIHLSATPTIREVEVWALEGITPNETHQPAMQNQNILEQIEALWYKSAIWAKDRIAYIFILWSIGFIFYSGRFFIGLRYLNHLKNSNSPVPLSWIHTMETLQQKINIRKKIRLLASPHLTTPITYGWLKPVIIFPASVISQLPMDQVESILLHELIHIRQRDYLISLLQSVAEMIFFFNPGYWYISSVLNKERENACDDQVVATTANSITYARALSRLAELCNLNKTKPALAVANNNQQLLSRIKRIINAPNPQNPMNTLLLRNRGYQLAPIAIFCILLALITLDVKGDIHFQDFSQKTSNHQLNDTTQNHTREAINPEKEILSTIRIGSYQIMDSGPDGTRSVISLSADSIFIYENNSPGGAEKGALPGKVDTLKLQRIQEEIQFIFANKGIKQHVSSPINNSNPLVINEHNPKQDLSQNNIIVTGYADSGKNSNGKATDNPNGQKGNAPLILYINSLSERAEFSTESRELINIEMIKKAKKEGKIISSLDEVPDASIGSLTVIKQDAEKIFGERGKNGVIIVTLKGEGTILRTDNYRATPEPQPYILVLEYEESIDTHSNKAEDNKLTTKSIAEIALKRGKPVSNFDEVDMQSIHSIKVLKDQHTELFGEKGKNGVIIVTLKEGGNTTGSPILSTERDFIVYPNPSEGLVKIRIQLPEPEAIKITAHDNSNKLIATISNTYLEKGEHEYTWDASTQPSGIYIITILKGKKSISRKVEIR